MIRGQKLGEGTFGIVYSATSPSSKTKYAVKRNLSEKCTSFIGVTREVDVLNKLRGHPHIVNLERVAFDQPFANRPMSPLSGKIRNSQQDDKLHFVFLAASYDLHAFIYGATVIDFFLMKRYMVQMLLGLEYLHGQKIIHRDIKPSNILINGDNRDALGVNNVATICDFGLAKPFTYQEKQSPDVVTAWYRAPEIALGCPDYDYKSDVWSLGCVFYEMICKRPFINRAGSNNEILSAILGAFPVALSEVLLQELVKSKRWRSVHLSALATPKTRKSFLQQINFTAKWQAEFEKRMGKMEVFLDLLENMLRFDWRVSSEKTRFTATQCLNHAFFADYQPLITATRSKYPPPVLSSTSNYSIIFCDCVERKWMTSFAINIFNNRTKFVWYNHRSIFQAMDLFDRYLLAMFSGSNIPANAIESEVKGLIHDKYQTDLRFMTCLYLCIKYFSSPLISYDTIVPVEFATDEAKIVAEEFERSFIKNCLQYNIYRPTVFEIADEFNVRLDEIAVRDLVTLYGRNPTIIGLTPGELFDYYLKNLRGKETDTLFAPFTLKKTVPIFRLVIHEDVVPAFPGEDKSLEKSQDKSLEKPVNKPAMKAFPKLPSN